MADNQGQGVDPLEDIQPRPSTFAERRTIAIVGGLAILVAFGVLVLALGTGAVPVSAADELAATAHRHPAGDRPAEHRADERR
ncbi:MAG TPA: hypothetical protein VLA79_13120 [Polyangia bacterium]|nr:hypothetical protein [Polyangia bacterium]